MEKLFDTPNLYVQSVDWTTRQARIVHMSRNTYSRSSFLDRRTIFAGQPKTIALDVIFQTFDVVQPPKRRINFIFHTAFCGSTLLSRCLDLPGVCFAYKEPLILHQLAVARRNDFDTKRAKERDDFLSVAMALLSRTYNPREIPLIKPSDSCINLARDLLRQHPDSAALLLHLPLQPFVVSMLKLPSRREFVRGMISRAQHDLQTSGFGQVDATRLSDAQAAGLVWLGLMYPYLDLLANDKLNIRSLDASRLYESPQSTLAATARLFNLSIKAETFKRVVEEGVFTRHSKNPAKIFDRTKNAMEKQLHQENLVQEIYEAVEWVDKISDGRPIPPVLPRPLVL